MAKKPLTGWRWFEAMGRRAKSQGRPLLYGRLERLKWPMWARMRMQAAISIKEPSAESIKNASY